jgi:HPt (histidine-containing phosphotransfer) domain-containing protein
MEKQIPYSFVDEADVMARLGGKVSLFNRLFGKYVEKYRHSDEEVRQLLDENDIEEAHLLVHSIKGTSGNLGIQCMWDAALHLDKALKDRDMDKIPDLYDDFSETLRRVMAEVDATPPDAAKGKM